MDSREDLVSIIELQGQQLTGMVVKMVLWDNDGVLMDTEGLFMLSNKQVLAQHGIVLTQEEFCDVNLTQGRSVLELISRGDEAKLDELRAQRDELYSQLLSGSDCRIPGMLDVVKAVGKTCRMAIVTSSKRNHFELMHKSSGIVEHMEFCLMSGDYPRSKPHPDPYLEAMRRAACSPDECLVVEDSPRGMQAAVAAGSRCVVIPNPLVTDRAWEEAIRVVRTPQELHASLQEIILGASNP